MHKRRRLHGIQELHDAGKVVQVEYAGVEKVNDLDDREVAGRAGAMLVLPELGCEKLHEIQQLGHGDPPRPESVDRHLQELLVGDERRLLTRPALRRSQLHEPGKSPPGVGLLLGGRFVAQGRRNDLGVSFPGLSQVQLSGDHVAALPVVLVHRHAPHLVERLPEVLRQLVLAPVKGSALHLRRDLICNRVGTEQAASLQEHRVLGSAQLLSPPRRSPRQHEVEGQGARLDRRAEEVGVDLDVETIVLAVAKARVVPHLATIHQAPESPGTARFVAEGQEALEATSVACVA
eukprot:scaffold1541_cov256-Pinguiococcus_pyrenoidosus.AAC.15